MKGLSFGIHIGKIPEDIKVDSSASVGIETKALKKAIEEDLPNFFTFIAYDQKTANELKELNLLCTKKRISSIGHLGAVNIGGEPIEGVFGLSLLVHEIESK